jgi:L-asparaginase II
MTDPLLVRCTRGAHVESEAVVDVAVVDAAGTLVAAAGAPTRATWWRSAAKPLQAAAVVRAGAADRYGFGDDALALACASHSGEDVHVALAGRMLAACGCGPDDLACGAHPSLSAAVHDEHVRRGVAPGPTSSNCSGKHAAMLALARHLGADVRGYERPDHVVQQRALAEVAAATGLPQDAIDVATDGCRAATFFVPLAAMARAWARLAVDDDAVLARLRRAMAAWPHLVAGRERSCTALMAAPGVAGRVVVKIGAEGVYCAALPVGGLGVALKVRSGDGRAAPIALCGVLARLDERFGWGLPHDAWAAVATPPVRDTRGGVVGRFACDGDLAFT